MQLLLGKKKDLDGFSVTRILPHTEKRMVGPFIFFDHMGPATFPAGEGINVRPHPHIGLATITYLLEGSLLHRDSLGNNIEIFPGDVNWMTAGRGIVHSERESIEVNAIDHTLNGIQSWVALPKQFAEIEPRFNHVSKCQLPHSISEGITCRLIIGEAYGTTSPIKTYSPMFYLDVLAQAGKLIQRPNPEQECAVYVISGELDVNGDTLTQGDFALLEHEQSFKSISNARCLLIGGEAWPKTPHMYWNFVSFDKARIEQAKKDWQENRFPLIPGDMAEKTLLPN